MQVSSARGVKVYNVAAGKTLPQWLSEKKKKDLRKDEEYRTRIELIQHLEFPTAPQCLQFSSNGEYLLASGTYKPQARCYELAQLGMKWERHMDCEVVKLQVLSPDYSKIVFLQADRHLEFHAKFGTYYKTRVPKCGRDMTYHPGICDLFVVGSSPEVWRLNLEQGRFLKPFETEAEALNVCELNPVHYLLGAGGDDGTVQCFDPRQKKKVGSVDCSVAIEGEDNVEVTALQFDTDGLTMAAGTSSGHVLLYDLRSSRPVMVKDHQYGLPMRKIRFHSNDIHRQIISCDQKIMKIWNPKTGKLHTSIEPSSDISDIAIYPNSGLIFLACEQPRVQIYFVPSLGPAPLWCSFLDALTEELEEEKRSGGQYEDYKFVTREDLEQLHLEHLVGTNMVKAYMHGFFIDAKLYARSKAVVNPFEYETYRRERLQQKIEAQRAERITIRKAAPKVNAALATKLRSSSAHNLEDEEDNNNNDNNNEDDRRRVTQKEKKKMELGAKLVADPRFKKVFEDPSFQIDENSLEYRLVNPSKSQQEPKKKLSAWDAVPEASGAHSTIEDENTPIGTSGSAATKGKKAVRMFEIKVGREKQALHADTDVSHALRKGVNVPLGTRINKLKAAGIDAVGTSLVANTEVSWTPQSQKRNKTERYKTEATTGNKRVRRIVEQP